VLGRIVVLLLSVTAAVVLVLSAGSGLLRAAASFKPCSTNLGSVASIAPCAGPPGTLITIRTRRPLPRAAAKVWFYETSSRSSMRGTICYTCAAVIINLAGRDNQAKGSIPIGSYYRFRTPSQLCANGSDRSWAIFLTASPEATYDYGDIGTFTIRSCTAARSAPSATSSVHPSS
jgi:hypothetical protein